MGCCKCLFRSLINFSVVFLAVVLMPGIPPNTVFPFEEFSIVKPKALSGALDLNTHLNNAEKLFVNKLDGAEHLLARGKSIYTGLHTGEVVRIDGEHITHIAKFGKPCKGVVEESICGRPLALAFDTQGDNLIVADAYYGIWEVKLATGQKTQLVSPDEVLPGDVLRPAKTFNSLAVAKNGDIYWSHSSSEYDIQDGANSYFLNPSGRLFRYSRAERKNYVLLDKLWFANGVVLSPCESFVLVAETHSSRIQKVHLKGEKLGKSEIFVEALPGICDNLTADEDGIWIPLVVSADPENPMLPQSMTKLAIVRKFIARVLTLIEMPFKMIQNAYPNAFTEKVVYNMGGFPALDFLFPKRTTIVRVDWDGKIVGALHGDDGTAFGVSHVLEFGEYLYLGSPFNHFIGRVKFVNRDLIHPKKIEAKKVEKVEAKKVEKVEPKKVEMVEPKKVEKVEPKKVEPEKPASTTQKPTTTTEKPVTQTTTQRPQTTQAPKTKPAPTPSQPPKQAEKPVEKKTAGPPKDSIPITEKVKDLPPPPAEKLKVIKKDGKSEL